MSKKGFETKLKITGDNKSAVKAIDGVGKKLNYAQKDIKGFQNGIAGILSSTGSMFTSLPFMASAAAIGVAGGFASMVKSTIDTAEHLDKMSQRVGLTAESLSTLTYAAELSGTEIGVFDKAIQRLSRNVDDTSRGIGEGKVAFDQLGISVVNADGSLKDADLIMKLVADKFSRMEDGTKKTALALKIFGRAGADLIPMLNGGAAGLERMQDEARNLGLEISTNTAKEAADLKDEMLRLERSIDGIALTIISSLLPILNGTADWFFENKGVVSDFVKATAREFKVLYSIISEPTFDKLTNFFLYGTNFELPEEALQRHQESLKATGEAADILAGKFMYVVNEAGEIERINLVAKEKVNEGVNGLNELIATEIKAQKEAERLARQWKVTKEQLSNEMELSGLKGSAAELVKIEQRVASLQAKFGNKGLIEEWANTMKFALMDINSIPMLGVESEGNVPGQLQVVEFDTSVYDAQKAAIAELTDFELANLAIREQGTLDVFNNMASGMMAFYELSGRQSKAAFGVYKIFASAEATISTIKAAQDAFAWGMKFGGPIVAGIAATSATIAGLGRVAQINAMSPGKGYSSVGGSGYRASTPRTNNYNSTTTNDNSRQITININSDYQDPDQLARTLVPSIEKAIRDGV